MFKYYFLYAYHTVKFNAKLKAEIVKFAFSCKIVKKILKNIL